MKVKRRPASERHKRMMALLEQIMLGHMPRKACQLAKVPYTTFKDWVANDDGYRAQVDSANNDANDVYRQEVRRRAIDGVLEPVFQGGRLVGKVRRYSDALLMFELRRRDPTYRDKVDLNHTGSINLPQILRDLDAKTKAREAEQPKPNGEGRPH